MHRTIQDRLEEVLAGDGAALQEHLKHCQECGDEVEAMRKHALLLRNLRAEAEPRAGFYARVMERIEAQGPVSIWNAFIESSFGRRIAVVSMALALLAGVYVVTEEQKEHSALTVGGDGSGLVWNQAGAPDRDAVLVNLVTYREQ
jgi:predicted anti-sigma-YlaC factor YlaD